MSAHRETESTQEQAIPTLGLRREDAAKALGLGVRKLDELVADRTSGIPFVRFGRAIVFPADALRAWLESKVEGGRR